MISTKFDTFIQVAESGSFTKAAEKLYITSTAVMKQINNLENEIGISLFDRTNHGIVLTESGESFYKDAKYMVQYYRDSVLRAQEEVLEKWKTIRIGNSNLYPSYFLIDLWPYIQKESKNLKIQLVDFNESNEFPNDFSSIIGVHADVIAGIWGGNYLIQKGIAFQMLSFKKLCCAVPIQHPLADKVSLQIKDLFGERLLFLEKGKNVFLMKSERNWKVILVFN